MRTRYQYPLCKCRARCSPCRTSLTAPVWPNVSRSRSRALAGALVLGPLAVVAAPSAARMAAQPSAAEVEVEKGHAMTLKVTGLPSSATGRATFTAAGRVLCTATVSEELSDKAVWAAGCVCAAGCCFHRGAAASLNDRFLRLHPRP
jgi:hypothetical protein